MPRRDSNLPSHPGRPYYYPGGGPGGRNFLTIEVADSRYFRPEVGGTIRGNVRFHGFVLDAEDRPFTRLTTSNRAPTTTDEAPEGTLWAYTGSPGSGGVSQVQVEDDNTSPTVASLLKFQGDVLSVVGGVAEFDLDGRYYPRDEIDDRFLTKDAADSRFFRPDVGGLISGDLVFGGSLEDTNGRPITRLTTSNRAPTTSDEAPEGTLWAYTGSPGSGGVSQVQVEGSDGIPRTVSLFQFPDIQVGGSGAVASISFDSRYRKIGDRLAWGDLDDVPGAFPPENHTLESHSGSLGWGRLTGYPSLTAGAGLTGGGSLSSSRSVAVDFGTGSNQVPRGNHNHDSRYLRPSVGGNISGDLFLTGVVEDGDGRPFTRLQTADRAPTVSDQAPEGTLWAYTGSPGSGGGTSQIQFEDDVVGPTTAGVLRFQGDVLSVAGGVASLDLDGRYAPLQHGHSWGEISGKPSTFPPSSHTHSTLSAGTGLSGSSYNGGTARTWSVDFAELNSRYLRNSAPGEIEASSTPLLTLRRTGNANNVSIEYIGSDNSPIYAGLRTSNSWAIGASPNLSSSPWLTVSSNSLQVAGRVVATGVSEFGGLTTTDNVGIRTSNPAYALDVSGTVQATRFFKSSSRRWKENIEDWGLDREALLGLRTVEYDLIPEKGGDHDYGFIAEEVPEPFASPERDAIEFDRITTQLVAGWQDHERRLEALEVLVTTLLEGGGR